MVKGIAWRGMKKIWCLLEIVSIIIKVKIYMFVGIKNYIELTTILYEIFIDPVNDIQS